MVYYPRRYCLQVIIVVSIFLCAYAFEIQDDSCCAYKTDPERKIPCCKKSSYTSRCCNVCDSRNNPTGLSYNCTYFNTNQPNKKELFYPVGQSINFSIAAYQRECIGMLCTRIWQACNLTCVCCQMYIGEDPGFKVDVWAPNGEGPKYSQYLNCTFPIWVPNPKGLYNFSCIFIGRDLASALKPIRLQLTSLVWIKLSKTLPPLSIDLRYVAGIIVSLLIVISTSSAMQNHGERFVWFYIIKNWFAMFNHS